jgi:tRNA-specific adenosine deaminase 2
MFSVWCSAGEVPVGCVMVCTRSGEVVARGHNETNRSRNATRHAGAWPPGGMALCTCAPFQPQVLAMPAELVAFDDAVARMGGDAAAAQARFRECTLYVTVEPCVMCAYALR